MINKQFLTKPISCHVKTIKYEFINVIWCPGSGLFINLINKKMVYLKLRLLRYLCNKFTTSMSSLVTVHVE